MVKDDASRNFIIVVKSTERWASFLDLNADMKESIREDQILEDYSALLPPTIDVPAKDVVRRISLFNQRALSSIQKKLKNVVTYCEIDNRDLRTKDYRPVIRKKKTSAINQELRCCECSKLLAEKVPTSGSGNSGKGTPDRRQDISEYESVDKKVKLEDTKIECL